LKKFKGDIMSTINDTMNDMTELCQQAIDTWGEDLQIKMMIDECSELIQALCKLTRKNKEEAEADVVSELADVELMLTQMNLMFGRERVVEQIEYKKNRLRERLGTS